MSDTNPRSRSKLRTAIVVIGVIVIAIGSGYLVITRFPNLFDRELSNPALIKELESAELSNTVAQASLGWPQWRGPNRDGRAPAGPFRADWDKNPLKEVWSTPCGGGYSSCSVIDGYLYTLEYDAAQKEERLICINATDGTILWKSPNPADYAEITGGYASGPRSTPTVFDGRVYTVGGTGIFSCIEAKPDEGKPATRYWQHDLAQEFRATIPRWGVACSPVVEGDLVIVQPGGKDGSVAAFDRITGERRWTCSSNPSGYSSPVVATVAGERMVLAMTGKALLGIRVSNGTELFSHAWVTQFDGNIATPIVVDDWVFISSGYGKGCALLHIEKEGESFEAKTVYFRPGKLMRNHHSSCVHLDGYLYGFDNETFRCIDLRKGEEVWDARGIKKGSVILVGRNLVGMTETGTLFLAEATPEEFKLIDKKDNVLRGFQCWSAPVVVNGRLFLRDDSHIVCFDVAN